VVVQVFCVLLLSVVVFSFVNISQVTDWLRSLECSAPDPLHNDLKYVSSSVKMILLTVEGVTLLNDVVDRTSQCLARAPFDHI